MMIPYSTAGSARIETCSSFSWACSLRKSAQRVSAAKSGAPSFRGIETSSPCAMQAWTSEGWATDTENPEGRTKTWRCRPSCAAGAIACGFPCAEAAAGGAATGRTALGTGVAADRGPLEAQAHRHTHASSARPLRLIARARRAPGAHPKRHEWRSPRAKPREGRSRRR